MKVVDLKGYMCDKCGKIYTDKYMAEICCKQYCCEECGKPTPKYIMRCDECQKKYIYNKATKMTYEEYIKKYPDYPIWDIDCDECYWELEDYIEHIIDETEPPYPTCCFGATKERLEIDIENVIDDINIDIEDGYGIEPDKELINFIDKWNKKMEEIFIIVILTLLEGYLNNLRDELKYTILPDLYLVFAKATEDEEIIKKIEKRISEVNDIEEINQEIEEYLKYMETEEFQEEKYDELEEI